MDSWFALKEDEINKRKEYLTRSSFHTYLQHEKVSSFSTLLLELLNSPLSVVSSGLPRCDCMLSEANVGTNYSGGFPVGTLTEFYGAPLTGKSYILKCVAESFVKKMLSIQQQYKASQDRDLKETQTNMQEEKGSAHMYRSVLGPEAACSCGAVKPFNESLEWDVYICLCASHFSGAPIHSHEEYRENWWNLLSARNRWSFEQNVYANDHIHVVSINHPNDLLDFLLFLDKKLQVDSDTVASANKPQQRHRPLGENLNLCANCTKSSERTVKAPLAASLKQPRCCFTRRTRKKSVLLLIDSLSWVWQHPALQSDTSHGNSHSMNWYAAELRRLLRVCLQTRFVPLIPASMEMAERYFFTSEHYVHEIMTTAIVTNGSAHQGLFTGRFQFPENDPSPHTGGSLGWKQNRTGVYRNMSRSASHPKPLGKEVWSVAPDYRLFLEVVDPHTFGDLSIEARNATSPSFTQNPTLDLEKRSGLKASFSGAMGNTNDVYADNDDRIANDTNPSDKRIRFRSRLYLLEGGSIFNTCVIPYMDL